MWRKTVSPLRACGSRVHLPAACGHCYPFTPFKKRDSVAWAMGLEGPHDALATLTESGIVPVCVSHNQEGDVFRHPLTSPYQESLKYRLSAQHYTSFRGPPSRLRVFKDLQDSCQHAPDERP